MIGLTEEVLTDIEKRGKKKESEGGTKGPPDTSFYQQITVLKEFNLKPSEWGALPRIDKKALYYYMIMHGYKMEIENEDMEKRAKLEEDKRDFQNSLPKQDMPHVRGGR